MEYLHYVFRSQNLDLINDQSGAVDNNVNYSAQNEDVIRLRYSIKLDAAREHVAMK